MRWSWRPEDQVFVPEQKDTVVVIGAIAHPGPAVLKPGQNIVEFFTQNGPELAGALDPAHVDLTNVQLIRKGQETAKVNLKDALLKKKGKQRVVALQSGDVVFLPPPPAAGERRGPMAFLQNLGPLGMLMGLFTGGLAHQRSPPSSLALREAGPARATVFASLRAALA